MKDDHVIFGGHLVAFLDLLGQSEELEKFNTIEWWKQSEEVLHLIKESYGKVLHLRKDFAECIDDLAKPSTEEELGRKIPPHFTETWDEVNSNKIIYKYISDSIIISVPLKINKGILPLRSIMNVLCCCAFNMLSTQMRGIFYRGGIEIGPCLYDSQLSELYGSALSKASKYEKEADYPRIIVGKILINYLDSCIKSADPALHSVNSILAQNCLSVISEDMDGQYIIDYLGEGLRKLVIAEDTTFFIKSGVESIEANIKLHKDDAEKRSKYERLKEYYKSKVDVWGAEIINFQ
ncbi:MAG: hypothetical protein HZC48_09795 [Nitrospirae bacterium]|nr:hypothetical protein [Nitrospirota bacterium]